MTGWRKALHPWWSLPLLGVFFVAAAAVCVAIVETTTLRCAHATRVCVVERRHWFTVVESQTIDLENVDRIDVVTTHRETPTESITITDWRLFLRNGGSVPLHATTVSSDDVSRFHRFLQNRADAMFELELGAPTLLFALVTVPLFFALASVSWFMTRWVLLDGVADRRRRRA